MSAETVAVLRLAPLAVGWPSVYRYVRREVDQVIGVFDRTVGPIVDRSIEGTRRRREVSRVLLSTSVKVCLAMSGYAQAIGIAFQADRAVLGGSFTRVYDDLFDNFRSPRLDERLTVLFDGGPFRPRSDAESLLLALYRAIEIALRREESEPVYAAVRRMHRFQIQSRQQRGSDVSGPDLRRITRGKGGLGTTALFGLLRPALAPDDERLLLELGDVLQVLDDYHDVSLDRATGVVTEVTLGTVTLAETARRIRCLRREFDRQYPRCSSDRLFGMLFMMLAGALLQHQADRRRRPPATPSRRRSAAGMTGSDPDDRRPHRLLLRPAGNIHPAAGTAPVRESG
ncbi:class 1 isoprenoid biosynthesis enzyme [Micromonospora cremea]|uniref:class 1 isoprenoid biosynthesis enzyme n=1 Tax=Micromonospora cremea TaxID=709881 RepID=UPI0009415A2D|nr:class 1 isoprenoid biosynthesis enzyme [Micromonospora cremea]